MPAYGFAQALRMHSRIRRANGGNLPRRCMRSTSARALTSRLFRNTRILTSVQISRRTDDVPARAEHDVCADRSTGR
jgi:hypothetical protein